MDKNICFSIIVVCLNAGDKLQKTVNSILVQDYKNYEIVVKDGGSSDGSVEKLTVKSVNGAAEELPGKLKADVKDNGRIRLFVKKDTGIYDAMNQAVSLAQGEYVLFLNCGDSFPAADVLKRTAAFIREHPGRGIYYGDTFCEQTGARVASPPRITPFVCYRNIPCHQSCFYKRELFEEKKYDTDYRIRADYDHFLWCCLKKKVQPAYMDFAAASYEGGGYSESAANKKRDREEHKRITEAYLSRGQRAKYRFIMALTLAPLRRLLAEKTAFSKVYNKVKAGLYK